MTDWRPDGGCSGRHPAGPHLPVAPCFQGEAGRGDGDALVQTPGADAGKERTTTHERRVSVDDTAGWLGIGMVVLVYIVIIAALLLYFAVESKVSELQWEIRGVRREVDRRGDAGERDVDRILRELRRDR